MDVSHSTKFFKQLAHFSDKFVPFDRLYPTGWRPTGIWLFHLIDIGRQSVSSTRERSALVFSQTELQGDELALTIATEPLHVIYFKNQFYVIM